MKLVATLACLLAAALSAVAWAQAASIEVSAPPDRLALPGAFVTLVYVVHSQTSGTATVQVTSQHGYSLLAPPATLELTAGATAPVAATVEVPADAPALTVDAVTLTVTLAGSQARGTVHITIGEKRGLAIEAPATVLVSDGQIAYTLINKGNVQEQATFEVSYNGTSLLDRSVTLDPGKQQTQTMAIIKAGSYEATLSVDGKALARAFTRVVQEGVPAPPPIRLHIDVTGSLDTNSDWGFSVQAKGPLSDYVITDGVLYADRPASSALTLDAPSWLASVGALSGTPLGLPLPSDLGAQGAYKAGPWKVGGAATWLGANRFAGYAFGGRKDYHATFAGAVGIHAGSPMAVVAANQKGQSGGWAADATLIDGSMTGSASASQRDPETHGTATFSVSGSNLLTSVGTLQVSTNYSDPLASLYGTVVAPIGSQAAWSGRAGTVLRLPTPLAGTLYLQMQGGTDESFASLGYAAVLGGGWQSTDRFGVTNAGGAFGVRMATSWTYAAGPGNTLGADIDLIYTPSDSSVTGRIAARYGVGFGPAAFTVSGGWDLNQSTIGIGSALSWDGGPWSMQVSADAGLDTQSDALSFGLGVSGHVSFDLNVPETIVEAAGGRKLATLEGIVHAGATGISGVTLKVGAYRVHTDQDGRFRAQLPPGKVRLQLELATLPIQYQVRGSPSREVTLVARRTVQVDFPTFISAALTGQVVLDSNGNGTPDTPSRSGGGTVLLKTASGNAQVLQVSPAGVIEARGLKPGPATLKLANLPLGAKVEHGDTRTVTLRAGEVGHVTFLVEPAAVRAQVFGANSFRIRRVETEISRVPPGAAPLVTVQVSGKADTVDVVVNGSAHPLTGYEGTWTGRIPVPRNARSGALNFQIVAHARNATSQRTGQLLIDPSADIVSARADGASHAGGAQEVTVTAYVAAADVTLTSPFSAPVKATESKPDRWTAILAIPNGTKPDLYSARYRVTMQGGGTLTGTVRFRVVAPH